MIDQTIGKLRVVLGLDNREFQQGLRSSAPRLQAYGRAMRAGIVGGALAAASALAVLTQRSMAALDAQAKLAQSLDTTVASVQVLERAGQLAGVSMSGIEQAAGDMTRRLSQAAASGGPVADALDRLHLSAEDLLALPLHERVAAVNDALERFIPAAERAAVAGQLFGEEGALTMTRIDSATLEQATDELERFGVIVSETDAEAIERANDALSQMGLIATGLGNRLAANLAPGLETVATWLAAMADQRDEVEVAIDNNTIAIGDEIQQIGRLLTVRSAEQRMSEAAALQILREARLRRENVRGMQEEALHLVRTSDQYVELVQEIDRARAARDEILGDMPTGEQIDSPMPGLYESIVLPLEIAERRLADLLIRQQEMLRQGDAAAANARSQNGESIEQLDELIERWQEAIDAAVDGSVDLGGVLDENVVLSERLTAETSDAADQGDRLARALADGSAFSARMLANLANIPGTLNALAGAVEGQVEALASQNRVLEIQLETGVSSAVAERQLQLQQLVEAMGDGVTDNLDEIAALQAEIAALNDETERGVQLREALAAALSGGSEGGGGGGGLNELQREAQQVFEATRTELERLNAEQQQYERLLRLGVITQDTYNRAMADLSIRMAEAEYPQLVRGIDSVSEALARAMVYGDDFGDAMARIFQQVAFDILNSGIREALQSVFVTPSGGGGGLFSGLLSGLFGGGGNVPVKSFAGGGFTGWDARTGGLDGQGGRLAMLHPQEIVTDLTRSAGVGGVVVKHKTEIINNAPGVEVREEEGLGRDGEALRRFVIDVVNQGGAGGRLDRMMGGRFGAAPAGLRR